MILICESLAMRGGGGGGNFFLPYQKKCIGSINAVVSQNLLKQNAQR